MASRTPGRTGTHDSDGRRPDPPPALQPITPAGIGVRVVPTAGSGRVPVVARARTRFALTGPTATLGTSNTKLIWTETPSNPLLRIVDLAGIAEIGAQAGPDGGRRDGHGIVRRQIQLSWTYRRKAIGGLLPSACC